MKITIDVPEMKCARCSVTAPIQPHLVRLNAEVPSQFRDALAPIIRERADLTAVDDSGRSWSVLADDKPIGWAKGPAGSDLCTSCYTLWLEAGKAFLVPPLPPPVEQPAAAETVSESEMPVAEPTKPEPATKSKPSTKAKPYVGSYFPLNAGSKKPSASR